MTESPHAKAVRRWQLVQEKKSKIVCRSIWLLITRKCPLRCRHCYFCGSPDGESMTVEQAQNMVKHLPAGVETIGISGGEPFTMPKLLRKTLESIQERNFPDLTSVTLQTLGFWASDRKKTIRILKELIELGANSFYIYGVDHWHSEQGLNLKNQEMLISVLKDEFGAYQPDRASSVEALFTKGRITFSRAHRTGKILPIGRGAWATKPEEQQEIDTSFDCRIAKGFLYLNPDGYIYTVNYNGEVHYCTHLTAPALGNIFDRPLVQLLKNARKRKVFRVLNEGNIVDYAENVCGIPREEAEAGIRQLGKCVYCGKITSQLMANRPDEPIMFSVFRREREISKVNIANFSEMQ